jgi:hypothetical protein
MARAGLLWIALVACAAPVKQVAAKEAPAREAPAEEKEGEDFATQVAALYRVAACGGEAALPEAIDAKVVDAHCKELRAFYTRHTDRWIAKARPVLAKIVPAGLPDKIVYPFGGGDLMTALATFPDATEITTISLETAGDVRTIDTIKKATLKETLDTNRENLRRLMAVAHSKTTNLQLVARDDLPGQLIFSLAALALYGFEPVSLRYFRINADGTLHYLTQAELDFTNVEIEYRQAGDAKAPIRTFRHIAFNLDDDHMGKDGALLAHLGAKGKITAMTKAASFLLWREDFSKIRDYLLANMEWMISDATGILPSAAKAAGFEQETWGKFLGPFLEGIRKKKSNEMLRLWRDGPYQALDFRYGYPDNASNAHLMVTRRAKK